MPEGPCDPLRIPQMPPMEPGGFTPFVAIASELTQDIIAEGP
jgi:hypothetical protein